MVKKYEGINVRGAYKILLVLWSLEIALFLASLFFLSSGWLIGWVFFFFMFFGFVIMVFVSAITILYYTKREGEDRD